MKFLLGKKDRQDSLRPLSEREIQKKLYGTFHGGRGEGKKGAGMEWDLLEPKRTASLTMPSRFFSLPWREVVGATTEGLRRTARWMGGWAPRLRLSWTVGLLAVGVLFLGVHALNRYRTSAMSAVKEIERPSLSTSSASSLPDLTEGGSSDASPLSPQASSVESSPAPPALLPPDSTPLVRKPYVIQVCTYAKGEDAQRLVNRLRAEELSAFSESLERPSGKTFYPVFLGRFETFREAEAKHREFQKHPFAKDFPDSFIRIL